MNTPRGAPGAPLSPVRTIAQVAKAVGWSHRRMARFLTHRNRELSGGLLVNAGRGEARPRWTVSESALRLVAEQWFNDPLFFEREAKEIREENAELKWRIVRLEKLVELQGNTIAECVRLLKVANITKPA